MERHELDSVKQGHWESKICKLSNKSGDQFFFNIKRFSEITELSVERLGESICPVYVPGVWGRILLENNLRYCPSCITHGYHSVFNQILVLKKCPIHETQLLDRCQYCGEKVPITISRHNIRNAYKCPTCRGILFDVNRPGKINRISNIDINKIVFLSNSVIEINQSVKDATIIWKEFPNLQQCVEFWLLHLQSDNKVNIYAQNFRKPLRVVLKNDRSLEQVCSDLQFSYVYYAIKKRIRRSILKSHVHCLDSIQRKLGGIYVDARFAERLGCIVSHAFLMWQVYWEDIQSLSGLRSRPKQIKWGQSFSLSRLTAERLFAHDCFESFWFYLHEAEKMDQEQVFYLQPSAYGEANNPGLVNWVVTRRADSEIVSEEILIWLRQLFRETTFKYSEKHFADVAFSCSRIATELYKKRWRN